MSMIVPPAELEHMEAVHARIQRGEIDAPYEAVRVTRDGEPLSFSVAFSPVKDALGGAIGVSSIFRDITPLKRAQETLLRENREKDQFLAVLSHELRNPLAPMRTSLEILRRQPEAARPDLRQTGQVMGRRVSPPTAA